MTDTEKLIAGTADIQDYNIEYAFDNSDIETLLEEDVISPRDIPMGKASDLIIDGVLSYDQWPFENFAPYEQLRQLENGAISKDEFFKLADFDLFDEEEKNWLNKIVEKTDAN